MNKLSLISLSLLSISLVACGKESDFKKAINKKINNQPACLNINGATLSSASYYLNKAEKKRLEEKTNNSYVVTQEFDKTGKNTMSDSRNEDIKDNLAKLDALTSTGLLSKSVESLEKYDFWGNKPEGGYYVFNIYNITDAGLATRENVQVDSMAKTWLGDNGNRIFCYAYPEVSSIENYTEGDTNGVHYAQVKYTYKYTRISDWAKNATVKAAFPLLNQQLGDTAYEKTIVLMKTNNGWSTDL